MTVSYDNLEIDLSPDVSSQKLLEMYETMLRIRLSEERIADLAEANEIRCPCHLYIGQEAIATGVCAALTSRDTVWGGHRSHGHYLAKGGDLNAMMAEMFGKRTGCSAGRGGSMHLFARDVGILGTVPLVSATIPLAVGAALAAKLNGSRDVAVAFFGDGAVEEGGFHESMNLAAIYELPVIFVCENNFYASHMELLQRRRVDNIFQLGEAHGMPGAQLDGNNVAAVYEAALEAAQRARAGQGPTLLECRTYRWRGHVGPAWDMDVGVQRRDELPTWLPRDPLARTRKTLTANGFAAADLEQMEAAIKADIEHAVERARSAPAPSRDELMEHVFVTHEVN